MGLTEVPKATAAVVNENQDMFKGFAKQIKKKNA